MKDNEALWNDYFISGTDVLKNNLGITDNKKLEEMEKNITLKKLSYLELIPIDGNFDSEHLKEIHKFLFDDIYPFAGKYRNCTLAKLREFVNPENIEAELNNYLKKMNDEVINITSKDYYAYFLSEAYYNLMVIHPFREGNGRSVREFLREFVISKNEELPFNVDLDLTKIDKKEALLAVQQRYIYPSSLEMLFRKALVFINDKNINIK